MTDLDPGGSPPSTATLGVRRRWITDWKVWLGIGVTVVAVYWTLRDVELSELGRALASPNPWLILSLLPMHVACLWVRAERWRYLTGGLSTDPLPRKALFRATAAGFMAVNVLPLRIGEIVRPWLLARQTGVRTSAALGTILIERAIDFTTIALIGTVILFLHTEELPSWVRSGAVLLALLGLIPFLLTLAIRFDEKRTLRLAGRALGALPGPAHEQLLDVLTQLARGITSLRGTRDVLMVCLYSLFLWAGVIAFTFWVGLVAFRIQLSPSEGVFAAYTALVFTALAVAAPAAPGFFGVYHFACREALALFGVAPALAVGYGTVLHLAYWVPVTGVGLVSLVRSGLHLADLPTQSLSKAGPEPHR